MPRIPEKSRRFRTKREICNDVATVLNIPLHYGTKFAVLSDVTWVWSEYHSKYKGCKICSELAAQIGITGEEKLIHDHAVPRNLIMEMLFRMKGATPEAVAEVLESYCVGVVITEAEDDLLAAHGLRSKMPANWDGNDPFARYKLTRIGLCCV